MRTAVSLLSSGMCLTRTPEKIGSTAVWDRISSGGYVSDHYVSTPSTTGFSAGLPRCSYPGQITSTTTNTRKSGLTGLKVSTGSSPRACSR